MQEAGDKAGLQLRAAWRAPQLSSHPPPHPHSGPPWGKCRSSPLRRRRTRTLPRLPQKEGDSLAFNGLVSTPDGKKVYQTTRAGSLTGAKKERKKEYALGVD